MGQTGQVYFLILLAGRSVIGDVRAGALLPTVTGRHSEDFLLIWNVMFLY